jgi:alpha-glucoside transport system substrate-binding protein
MRSRNTRRGLAAAAALVSTGLVLAGCGGDDDEGGSSEASGTWPGEGMAECEGLAQLADFGDLNGKEVSLYTSIVAPEDQPYIDSFKLFETCTGATVEYEGSKEFETQLPVRVESGSPPDIAFIPQPGLLQSLVQDYPDAVKEAPQSVSDNVDEFYGADWKAYGTVDDVFYAPPLTANVKSFVWYSPKMFSENGWEIPTTWDEMIALSDTIADSGIKPWCAGIGSGEATGWPATDWLEDVLLRTAGPDVYDQWVNHEIPFDDPAVAEGLDTVGDILKNNDYVNGGFGDFKTIASTEFTDGGLPILDGECAMHRMASFYAANWPEGTDVSENGDAFAFYLPPIGEEFGSPVLGGGEFVTAFSDSIETQALMTYISGGEWVNEKGKATTRGGFVSANKNLDIANVASPIDKASVEILQNPDAVFRFDGSDLMPGPVGAGSFWKEMTAWIGEDQSTEETLGNIESSWPSS